MDTFLLQCQFMNHITRMLGIVWILRNVVLKKDIFSSRPMYMSFFISPRGLFKFRMTSFGLKYAPTTFMKLMYKVLSQYISKFCCVYLDDILVYIKSIKDHLVHLTKVLERFFPDVPIKSRISRKSKSEQVSDLPQK